MLVNSNLSCSDYLTMVRVASSHYLTIMAATAQFACPRHDASARLSNLAPYDRQYRSATRWCGGGSLMRRSRGCFEPGLEGGAGLEDGPEDIDAPAGQGDDGLMVAFSLAPLAV
jgi:hypothetical protein